MRTSVLVGAALAVVLVSGACGNSPSPAGPSAAQTGSGGGGGLVAPTIVAILGGGGSEAFNPSSLTVAAGVPVAFFNSDTETHQIVADDGSFDTGVLEPDDTSAPILVSGDRGTYHCAIHPGETGVVKPSN
jgi:plastocyanin